MVLKFRNRGVRSGITLRSPSKTFLRAYRKYGYIITKDSCINREKFDGHDVLVPNIEYSLNKKGRWLLAEQLSEAIKTGTFELESCYNWVQLIDKRSLRNRSEHCVSVCFSKDKARNISIRTEFGKRKKRRSCYTYAQSLKNIKLGPARKKKKNRLRATGQTDDEDEGCCVPVPHQNEMSFDVVYPNPSTHTYKLPGNVTDKIRQRSKHTKRRKCNQDIVTHDSYYFDHVSEQFGERYEVTENHLDTNNMRSNHLYLADFLHQALNNRVKKRKIVGVIAKPRNSSFDQAGVTGFCNITDDMSTNTLTGNMAESTDENYDNDAGNTQPVRVILDQYDTDMARLSRVYGDRYVECACRPRKFIIDISDDVMTLDVFSQHWKQNVKPVHACVVFVHDIDNEINTRKDRVYKVYLNTSMSDDATQQRITTLFDYTEVSVDFCLKSILFFIESLPDLVQFDQQDVNVIKETSKYRIESLYGWKTMNYFPKDEGHFRSFMISCQTSNADGSDLKKDDSAEYITSISSCQSCGICYDDIGPECSGTALKQCGHWFCDGCWRELLTLKVKSRSASVQCPEYNCKSVVDYGTMLSLLSIPDVVKLAKFDHDSDVDRNEDTTWCPNVRCGRVLVRTDPEVPIVPCDCGHKLCFDCLGPAHWPAPCESVDRYQSILNEPGFSETPKDSSTVHVIHGRHCPGCKRFFEKINGCPFMACLCGTQFCWGCGLEWNTTNHGDRCYELGQKLVHINLTCKFVCSTSLHNEWLVIALDHRQKQQPVESARLKLYWKKKIKGLALFMNTSANTISLEFKGSKREYIKESHKVPEFMENLFDIQMELHFIAENMAVSLATDTAKPHENYYKTHLKKLQFYCGTIEECLASQVDQNSALQRLRKMKAVRSGSLKLIKGIIAFTKSRKHVQMKQ